MATVRSCAALPLPGRAPLVCVYAQAVGSGWALPAWVRPYYNSRGAPTALLAYPVTVNR